MFDLAVFSLSDMLQCSAAVRDEAADTTSMEAAAAAIVRYLHTSLVDKATGDRSLSLVRFYKTHAFERLEPGLQEVAAAGRPLEAMAGVSCLTLLASAGDEPAWNDRRLSQSHRAIALASQEALAESPMVLQLVRQLGVEPARVVEPHPELFREMDQATYNVFYVAEALGSPYVPAQRDFVERYGIRSVLGFGGVLPNGALFAVVMFSKSFVPAGTADAFATIALSVKLAILSFVEGRVFDSDPPPPPDTERELRLLRSQNAALEQLLDARQRSVITQSARLEQAVQAAEERAVDLTASRGALASSEAHKSAVVRSALDAVITMDASGCITEFNPSAERIFGYPAADAVGQPLAELIIPPSHRAGHVEGLARYLATGEGPVLNHRIEIDAMRAGGEEFPVELTITPVPGMTEQVFTAFVRDISDRRRAEAELVESHERTAHIARTLQNSLLPPVLPDVPGVEVAAVYRPVGTSNEVGGDFYDAFEIGRNDWAFTLGDVVGKGAEAAALTGLARYTLRAAAMRTHKPGAVLSTLNSAVHRQHPDQFCTVAFARLKLSANGARLSAASGGHPSPLVLRPTGVITEAAPPGLLLGPFPNWTGSDRHTRLHAGDVVVLYSDGVTEARNGQDQFGEERLRVVLGAHAGDSAAAVAGAIEQAVKDHSPEPSDDIAILVVRLRPEVEADDPPA